MDEAHFQVTDMDLNFGLEITIIDIKFNFKGEKYLMHGKLIKDGDKDFFSKL